MSAKTETPGVNSAVHKLQELEDRMKTEDFGFKDKDVDNIDGVIDAVYELEKERKSIHDELEKETIKSSIMRHQLRILPGQIREEIMEAVMSARNSNAKVLLGLQDQLKTMNASMETLNKQSREYEQENAVLQPERELLKQQHEEIITQLNQRMSEKASMQIALNETRDKVRQANQDIVDLEDGILQLKEDLIQERTEARHEKKRLRRAVTDTTQKTRDQKDQNVTKKKELDGYQEKLGDSEGKLDTVRKSIRRFETSRAKLEGEERALATELTNQLKMNDQMRIQGADIMNKKIEEERRFKEKEKEMQETIQKFMEDIEIEGSRKGDLDKRRMQLRIEFGEKDEKRQEDKAKVDSMDAVLQATKEDLNRKAEEVGAMQKENIDMQVMIEELAESHKAVLAQLNKQIEEYKEQLAKERKERMEVQANKDKTSKALDDLRTDSQVFMSSMTNLVTDGKKRHVELSNEGMMLQRQLKEDEVLVADLEGNLKDVQGKYEAMFNDYQKRQDMMESQVLRLEALLESSTKELEVQTPIFEELEIFCDKRTEEYDAYKKHTVALKNKKTGLEDQIKQVLKETDMLKQPQGPMRDDIKKKRVGLVSQMKANGEAMKSKEGEILETGCKLRLVMEENQRFNEAIAKMQADLEDIHRQMAHNKHLQQQLELELQKQKQELMKKWETDVMMQDFFASRDKATAEAFARLLGRTQLREQKIDMVTGRLMEELGCLSDFLDNISHRRPEQSQTQPGVSPGEAVEAVVKANRKSAANPDGRASHLTNHGGKTPAPGGKTPAPGGGKTPGPHSPRMKSQVSSPKPTPRNRNPTPMDVKSPRAVSRTLGTGPRPLPDIKK